MRKRWKFDPFPYVMVWYVGGLVGWIAVALWNGKSGYCGMNSSHIGTLGIVGLCVWLGPFAVVIVGGAIVLAAGALWHGRPRRVVEPITTDLRKVGLPTLKGPHE